MPITYTKEKGKCIGKYKSKYYETESIEVAVEEEMSESEIKLLVAKELLRDGKLSPGAFMGIVSAIKSPKSKDFMKKIGKAGCKSRWGKKK